jgi:hypothetical protein
MDQRQQASDSKKMLVTVSDVHEGETATQPPDLLVQHDELTDPATVHPGNSVQIELQLTSAPATHPLCEVPERLIAGFNR